MGRPRNTLESILRRTKVDENGCWIWLGLKDKDGYGTIMWANKGPHRVHRVVYEHYEGNIPDGLTIDHLCRNRACCNPSHLEAVSNGENVLRGNTFPAVNAAKTHCIHGHPYDEENTYILHSTKRKDKRVCRICQARRMAEWYQRKKSGI